MTQALPVTQAAPEVSFGEHYARIRGYVGSVVRDAGEAQELTQETFLRAYVDSQRTTGLEPATFGLGSEAG